MWFLSSQAFLDCWETFSHQFLHSLTQHQYLWAASEVEHFYVWKPQVRFIPMQETSLMKPPLSTRGFKVRPKGDAKCRDIVGSIKTWFLNRRRLKRFSNPPKQLQCCEWWLRSWRCNGCPAASQYTVNKVFLQSLWRNKSEKLPNTPARSSWDPLRWKLLFKEKIRLE